MITLTRKEAIEQLIVACEMGNRAGAYELKESALIAKVVEHLKKNNYTEDISELAAVNVLLQGVRKANEKGIYDLHSSRTLWDINEALVLNSKVQEIQVSFRVTDRVANMNEKLQEVYDMMVKMYNSPGMPGYIEALNSFESLQKCKYHTYAGGDDG